MTINDKGIGLIKEFEGCKLKAYQDVKGVWTIGYGSTLYPNGNAVHEGDEITQQQAEDMLKHHVKQTADIISIYIKSSLTSNQFSALCVLAYNIGAGAFRLSTLLKMVNSNPNDQNIKSEFLKWNKSGGKVYPGLTRRRQAEADLYFTA